MSLSARRPRRERYTDVRALVSCDTGLQKYLQHQNNKDMIVNILYSISTVETIGRLINFLIDKQLSPHTRPTPPNNRHRFSTLIDVQYSSPFYFSYHRTILRTTYSYLRYTIISHSTTDTIHIQYKQFALVIAHLKQNIYHS